MDRKQKILFCGDVEGKFDGLFDRIGNINKKSGPFDCVFCVGNFFGINNKEFEAYKTGQKNVPIPVYILGANDPNHIEFYPDSQLCDNVYCLGKRGVFTNTKGLKVAYISGIASDKSGNYEYNSNDILELYNTCVRGNPSFRGVDVLLASQWPENITNFDTKQVSLTVNKTTNLLSWLIMKIKPRYVVSGLEGVHYERAPFRCPNLTQHEQSLEIVTRFIGLARVCNSNKSKWLYALNLTPLDQMKISELLQKTTDETECPFDFQQLDSQIFRTKRKSDTTTQYFYDTSFVDDSQEKRPRRKRQKIEFDQSKCWFCLASPTVEKQLIITVGNSAYLVLAKGGLIDDHLLICPIEHYQNNLDLPEEVLNEIEQFKAALRKMFAKDDKIVVFFERNYKTSHMQLQVVPIPATLPDLKTTFQDEADIFGVKLETLQQNNRLDQVLQKNCPYFSVELPDGSVLYTKIKGQFPLNFARDILASESILNLRNRSDWKECVLSKEREQQVVEKLRKDFQPYDFTE